MGNKDRQIYMLVLEDYEPDIKKYDIFDVTASVVYSYGRITGTYSVGDTRLTLEGHSVEFFYSIEGAVAFAAAYKLSGESYYDRERSDPPKP